MLALLWRPSPLGRLARRKIGLVATVIVLGIASTIAAHAQGRPVSAWQICRSSIWIAASVVTFVVAGERFRAVKTACRRFGMVLEAVFVLMAASIIVELATGLPLAPAVIRYYPDDSELPRLYAAGVAASVPLAIFFMRTRRRVAFLATATVVFATQGKAVLLALALGLGLEMMGRPRSIRTVMAMLVILLVGIVVQVRVLELLDVGDMQRARQIVEGVDAFESTPVSMMIGIGHGVAYSEGYGAFAEETDENERLLDNSRYDLENGPVFLLLRFGILGTLLVAMALHPHGASTGQKLLFWLITLVYFSASAHLASPGGPVCLLAFALLLANDTHQRAAPASLGSAPQAAPTAWTSG